MIFALQVPLVVARRSKFAFAHVALVLHGRCYFRLMRAPSDMLFESLRAAAENFADCALFLCRLSRFFLSRRERAPLDIDRLGLADSTNHARGRQAAVGGRTNAGDR